MANLNLVISGCLSTLILYSISGLPETSAQGVSRGCVCWSKLGEVLRESQKDVTEPREKETVWVEEPLYSLLRNALRGSDMAASQEKHQTYNRQPSLKSLLLNRPERSEPLGQKSSYSCSLCWAALQDLLKARSLYRSSVLDSYGGEYMEINKKAMLNNGW